MSKKSRAQTIILSCGSYICRYWEYKLQDMNMQGYFLNFVLLMQTLADSLSLHVENIPVKSSMVKGMNKYGGLGLELIFFHQIKICLKIYIYSDCPLSIVFY